jgi:dolichol-phosphate mannosyltransferase
MTELCIVVPTFNERGNVRLLLAALEESLAGIDWEAIFVDDDSPDGTADEVRAVAREDRRVRCLQRVGRRGLASACVEGMMASAAPYLAVLDADMQHDETLLPAMLRLLREDGVDLVVGSRYVAGGSALGGLSGARVQISRLSTALSRLLKGVRLTDPMSGFFMLRRSLLERAVRRLSGKGFKILLDLVTATPGELRVAELPYAMRSRAHGESKLDALVAWEFLVLLIERRLGRVAPVRFVLFVLVGLVGAVLHLAILGLLFRGLEVSFWEAQTAATLVAMVLNFGLNNSFTYRDRRLRGLRFARGLAIFIAVCSVGALVNVRLATFLLDLGAPWTLAGVVGAGVGAVWNYAVSSTYAWDGRRR